jgi:hypothetical protein
VRAQTNGLGLLGTSHFAAEDRHALSL